MYHGQWGDFGSDRPTSSGTPPRIALIGHSISVLQCRSGPNTHHEDARCTSLRGRLQCLGYRSKCWSKRGAVTDRSDTQGGTMGKHEWSDLRPGEDSAYSFHTNTPPDG